jgi:DNA polymerase elongation subunit (family B)
VHITINVETVYDHTMPLSLLPSLEDMPSGNAKDPLKVVEIKAAKLEEATSKLCLSPLTGRICVIGYAKQGQPPVLMEIGSTESAFNAHQELNRVLDGLDGQDRIITYNGKKFDIPYILTEQARLGIDMNIRLLRALRKYGNIDHCDVFADIFDETKSLKAWNLRFNGPAIFGDGSMVGQWHREAMYEHIQRHCASNIVATRYLYDRLQRIYLAKVTTNR